MVTALPPAAGFLTIIVATFVLEDVAIVGTALLAADHMVDPLAGLAALLIGIVVGDLGLFGLGYGAARLPGLRRYVDTQTAQSLKHAGTHNTFSIVFSSRFVPGMRLPTYTSLGYVGASFWRFTRAVVFAVSVWTIGLYAAILFVGQNVLTQLGPWKYAGIGLVLVALVVFERSMTKRRQLKQAGKTKAEGERAPSE